MTAASTGDFAARTAPAQPVLRWSVLVVPTLVTILTALPAFLSGTLAVDLRAELDFSAVALGALVAIYGGLAATIALPAGRFAARIGYVRGIAFSSLVAGAAMIVPAVVADRWWHLAAAHVVGSVAASVAVPSVQEALTAQIPAGKQGIGFGLNLAAVPAAILLAGIAVPVVGETLGWRWAFGFGGMLGVVLSAISPWVLRRKGIIHHTYDRAPIQRRPVALATGAMFLGVFAAQSVATFAVESGVADGHSAGSIGYVLAIASASAILVRIGGGLYADRTGPVRSTRFVTGGVLLGFMGVVMLASGDAFVITAAGVILGIGFGWGWNGVIIYALIRRNPGASAMTSAAIMMGGFSGSAIGPVVSGFLVSAVGFSPMWAVSAVMMGLAAFVARASGRALNRIPAA